MLLIRRVEEKILSLFNEGKVSGTTHTYIGQEANAVALMGQLDNELDYVLSNHRNHGHYLAFGGPVDKLIYEIMGLPEGVCGGRGGSQHIKYGHFMSNGVQAGLTPIGCGMAMGEKMEGTGGIVVVCIGDGTLGEGVLYESLNMASLWELPVLFLVENNYYAQTTPLHSGVKGSISGRGEPFDIFTTEITSTDVEELRHWSRECIDYVRVETKPIWAVINTYRLAPHSKGDEIRDPQEIERHRENDPLKIQARRLAPEQLDDAERWVQNIIIELLKRSPSQPL